MPLFVATHQHPPEACPVAAAATELLSYVSAATATRYGVTIHAEAVVDGEHALILILQAPHREQVERFMEFFARFGDVQVRQASSNESAVARGGCLGMELRESVELTDGDEPLTLAGD